jgi:hypothetical protein
MGTRLSQFGIASVKEVGVAAFKNGLYSFAMWGFPEGGIARDRGVVMEAFDAQDWERMLIIGNRSGKTCFTGVSSKSNPLFAFARTAITH